MARIVRTDLADVILRRLARSAEAGEAAMTIRELVDSLRGYGRHPAHNSRPATSTVRRHLDTLISLGYVEQLGQATDGAWCFAATPAGVECAPTVED